MNDYFDHAATSWPKSEAVCRAVSDFLRDSAANPGRSSHKLAQQASMLVESTRLKLARLLKINTPERLIWTSGCTMSLNMALFGFLKANDRVLISPLEHNAVIRPLMHLSVRNKVRVITLRANSIGQIDLDDLSEQLETQAIRLVCLNHVSNVNGVIQDLEGIVERCHKAGSRVLVDAAQSMGYLEIDVAKLGLDLLAFPAHKGLGGLTGLGGLYVGPGVELEPLVFGGTGGSSASPFMPDSWPQRFESGTLNAVAIAGLKAALEQYDGHLAQLGATQVRLFSWLKELRERFPEITWQAGFDDSAASALPVFALNLPGWDCHDLAHVLDSQFQIAARAGLHCAPKAHKHLGSFPGGSLRLALGHRVSEEGLQRLETSLATLLSVR